jgi:hypothetical protein
MASPASAHEPHSATSGYVSSVTDIKPLILGLEARVLGGQDKLFVRWTRTRVVVAGHVIGAGRTASWHDHRIGWFHDQDPAVVRSDPDQQHFIRAWRIPGTAGGKRFVIRGLLGYAPPPASKEGGAGDGWILPAALAAGVLAVGAAAVGVGARRRERRRAP